MVVVVDTVVGTVVLLRDRIAVVVDRLAVVAVVDRLAVVAVGADTSVKIAEED